MPLVKVRLMDLKRIAKDTSKVLMSYITFQAVKTVMNQLREMDPPAAYWLNAFSTKEALQDGEVYLSALLEERADLAIRIMTVRQHIAEGICEFLPEMLTSGIQQANMEHRRIHLERITQMESVEFSEESELPSDSDPTVDS